MKVKEITDKEQWEGFLEKCREKTFLQSFSWGEVQKRKGNTVWRFGVYEGGHLRAVALVVKLISRRGTFLLVPHGPVVQDESREGIERIGSILRAVLEELEALGKREGAAFIRIAPLWQDTPANQKLMKQMGLRKAPIYAEGAYPATWKLELAPTEEQLFSGMRKTTRYLVRQNLKNKEVTIEKSIELEDLETFWQLTYKVARRQQFVPFSYKHTRVEFETFARNGEALWIFGKVGGEVAAGALVLFWSGIGFYHQAASLGEYVKFSLPYLVQWEAIKEAKRRGCSLYDFWGYVDPKAHPKHPWAGPTLFKMGFGGRPYEYVKTQDYPLNWRYWLIAGFETLRRIRRHL